MSKEMIISTSRHETKVALVEEGQVVEIFVEREKKTGLVGSIYKGRVTRVLPGMQSAFIDVGLDRDAFLYVSDFTEDLEEYEHAPVSKEDKPAPSRRRRSQRSPRKRASEGTAEETSSADSAEEAKKETSEELAQETQEAEGAAAPETEATAETPAESEGETSKEVVAGEEPPLELPERRPAQRSRSIRQRRRGGRGRGGRDRGEQRLGTRTTSRPESAPSNEPLEPVLLPGESLAAYRDQAAPSLPAGNITEDEAGNEPSKTLPLPSEDTGTELSPVTEAGEFATLAPELSEIAKAEKKPVAETDSDTTSAPPETPGFNVDEPVEDQALDSDTPMTESVTPLSDETTEKLAEESVNVEAAQDPDETAAGKSETKEDPFAEFPAEAFFAETREQLNETLEEIERVRSYEAEVGLPPWVQERTANDVEWQEATQEKQPAEGAEQPVAADEKEPEQPAAPDEKPAGRRGRTRRITSRTGRTSSRTGRTSSRTGRTSSRTGRTSSRTGRTSSRTGRTSSTSTKQAAGTGRTRRITGRTKRTDGRSSSTARPTRTRRTSSRPSRGQPAIADLLKAGQEIIIQIAKEQIGQKGARITSHVTLPGRYIVYMPTIDHIGVSRKIGSADDRSRLRRLLSQLKGDAPGGFVVRTAAADCTDDELRADVDYLVSHWREIQSRADKSRAPHLLHADLNLVERLMRDQLTTKYESVWMDNEEEYTRVVEFVGKFLPKLSNRIKLYTRDTPIFEEMGVQQEIDRALRAKVWLKSGGYIVINQTEALVAIDINTGKFVGKGSTRLEDTIVKTNLDAIKEIVRQIRLRDLGGIIVIDFIDMEDRRNRQKVMRALEQELRLDRSPSKILSFNEFGLVAITRKRSKQSLERVLCQPCPYCVGSGMLKSVQTLCIEIHTEALKMASEMDAPELTIHANPDIVTALKGSEAALVRELEELTDKNIILQPDDTLHFEHYNIF